MKTSKRQMVAQRNRFHNQSLTKKVEELRDVKRWENENSHYNFRNLSHREKRLERKLTKCYNY